MSLGDQSALVFWASVLSYFVVAVWMTLRGWLIRAGLASAVVAYLPLAWQTAFTDSEAPGFGLLFIGLVPISLVLLVLGLASLCMRAAREGAKRGVGAASPAQRK